jgi:AraC family transcriptional regulator
MIAQRLCTRHEDGLVDLARPIDGAWFYFSDMPRPEPRPHTHDCVLLSFLLKGIISEEDDRGQAEECGPISLHASPQGATHRHVVRSSRVTRLCFSIRDSLFYESGMAEQKVDEPINLSGGVIAELAPKFYREVMASDEASVMILKGLIFELVGEIARGKNEARSTPPPPWLVKAREMLHDAPNQTLSITAIAAEVGVHPSHLCRSFREHIGQTPGEYLRRVRIERSLPLVLTSNLPLKAVAARAGFADQAHFTREFRHFHGLTPAQMRRSTSS